MEMSVAPPNTKRTRRMFLTGRTRALAVVIIIAGMAGWIYHREAERAYRQWRNELPRRVWQRLHSAKSVTLYSLYPEVGRSPEKDMPWVDGVRWDELLALRRFRGYPIMGEFECSDPSLLKRIASDLREGTQREGSPFMCFLPRHGVLLSDSEGTLELVICFQCQQLELYEDGEPASHHILEVEPSCQSILQWNAEFARRGIRVADTTP